MGTETRAATASGATDSELSCPTCDYNLTGLTENRCPECGEAFDPEQVRRLCSTHVQPATPWDTPGGFRGFWQTWLLALTQPKGLAANFPRRHSHGRAAAYARICYASALLPCFVVTVVFGDEVPIGVSAMLAAATAFGACEILNPMLLAWIVDPTCAKERHHFWRGLVQYTSSHAVLSGFLGACALFLFISDALEPIPCVVSLGAFSVFSWWAFCLISIVVRRSRPGVRRALGCVVVLAVGLSAILLGLLVFCLVLAFGFGVYL